MHESAKVLVACSIASVLIGIGWGLQLKRADAETRSQAVENRASEVGAVSSLASTPASAAVVAAETESRPEKPRWVAKPDGSEVMQYDKNWTFFRSIDPITDRPIRQVCGYDAEWLGRRVCIGGPFENVTFRAVNETIDFDVWGTVAVDVRFDTEAGPVVRSYVGFAASQWDGVILAKEQVPDFMHLLNRSRKTVIRFKLTEGYAVITLNRYPRVHKEKAS